jgi:tetratricopeptide (TPR) repeat protein
MTALLRYLLLVIVMSASTIATAQPDPFDTAYAAGEKLFGEKKYAEARAEFQKAFDIRQEPILLYNIAQTYRFQSDAKQAIEWFRRYLAASNTAIELREKSEKFIAELEASAKPTPPDSPITQPPVTNPANPNPTTPTTPSPIDEGARKRRIPLGSKIAAGVTGVGLISALVFTKLGLDAEKDLKNPDTNPMQSDANKVERYQNLINVSWGVTGAAAITAVVIYFAAPSYATDRNNVVIAPNRDGGWSAALTARF